MTAFIQVVAVMAAFFFVLNSAKMRIEGVKADWILPIMAAIPVLGAVAMIYLAWWIGQTQC